MIWLELCPVGWGLYDFSVRTGRWKKYLIHREKCTECRLFCGNCGTGVKDPHSTCPVCGEGNV